MIPHWMSRKLRIKYCSHGIRDTDTNVKEKKIDQTVKKTEIICGTSRTALALPAIYKTSC